MRDDSHLSRGLFKVEEQDGGWRLYVAEISTVQSLEPFAAELALTMSHFAGDARPEREWIGREDLPDFGTVGDLRSYFDQHDEIVIIDIDLQLHGVGTLSTHDDGEASFSFERRDECERVLDVLLPSPGSAALRKAILRNLGKYISCNMGSRIRIHDTFDAYLASARLIK